MALLKRYGVYTIIATFFLFAFYKFSAPLQLHEYVPAGNVKVEDQISWSEVQQPERPGKPGISSPPPKVGPVNWTELAMMYPVESMTALPTAGLKPLPRIQHEFGDEDATAKNIRESRQKEVSRQFLKCWASYREKAWMKDELMPISGNAQDPFGGWAASLIDSLDTLWIMGFKNDFMAAIQDIETIDFGSTTLENINVFETNIRHLGGLLAAYELSGEKRLLAKAQELGDVLYHAFDTPNHMPLTRWNMQNAASGTPQLAPTETLLAELGSFSLEFTRLSQLTKNPKWYDAAHRITQLMHAQQMETQLPGLWPVVVDALHTNLTTGTWFTLTSMADSAYEYLPKTYALLGGTDPLYKDMYERAMSAATKHTLFRPMTPANADLLAAGIALSDAGKVTLNPELQHLACYTGAMFALGSKLFGLAPHLDLARKLTDTCVWAYKAMPSGIMPETAHLAPCPHPNCTWDPRAYEDAVRAHTHVEPDPAANIANLRLPEGFVSIEDRAYKLRPEAIESVFVMYRVTGEQRWQAAAWDMWTAVQGATQTKLCNAAVEDVSVGKPPRVDRMESFWMAETLKYFYLVFSEPGVLSLDEYVFSTEAHPFKIAKPVA